MLHDANGTPTQTDRFYYDGKRIIEHHRNGSLHRQYVYGLNYINELVAYYDSTAANASPSFILQDANYNVIAITDDSGTLLQQYSYWPYGEYIAIEDGLGGAQTESDLLIPFGFQGMFGLHEINGYAAGPRIMSTYSGNWYQRDPNGQGLVVANALAMNGGALGASSSLSLPSQYDDGMGLYAYSGSNPVRFSDPEGLEYHPILTGPPYQIIPPSMDKIQWFLSHFLLRPGTPVFLHSEEANEVMDTLGVRNVIDNHLTMALDRAKKLQCKPPQTVRGQYDYGRIGKSGEVAVAPYPFNLIIGRFIIYGKVRCSIRKTCVRCKDGSMAYRAHAGCDFALAGKDPYDFEGFAAKILQDVAGGVPFSILWTWDASVGKSAQKNCKDGSAPAFPRVGGGGASW